MKKTLIFAAILLVTSLSYAQSKEELKVKFGKISDKEMAMTSYAKDSNATAVILFDKGYLSRGNFNAFEKHIRIKIFKKEAYHQANFRVVYNRGTDEMMDGLKASCFNLENGKIIETKATSDNIVEEELYKDVYVKKITVPAVREGSIIDFKYTINNPDIKDWYFQSDIPTIWSEYEMAIPEFYIFTKIGQGNTPYAVNETDLKNETLTGTDFMYSLNISRWIQKDVPAIKSETFMTSVEDYRTKLSFHLEEIRPCAGLIKKYMGSWTATAKMLMEHEDFGDFMAKKSAMKEELASFIKEGMTPIQKVQAVYDYVGKNFDAESDFYSSIYVRHFLKTMKQKRKVTVSEINLIFLNMLKTLGIEASPVLTRSREDGRVATSLAALRRFNRVLAHVKIEKDTFFVDVSGYPQPMKLLPFNALSGYGVEIMDKEKYAIVVPQSKITTRRFSQANLSLNTEGVLSGDINFTYSGYEAFNNRKTIKDIGEDKYMKNAIKDLITDGKLESQKIDNTDIGSDTPLKGVVKITSSAYVNKTDDKIYINPNLCFSEKENPFKAEERQYDIDFGAPHDDYYQMTLTLPEGYKVEETPKSVRLQMPEGAMKFEYLVDIKDNKIFFNTKLNIKRTMYFANEYPLLKDLYAQILVKMGEQIVLTKATK